MTPDFYLLDITANRTLLLAHQYPRLDPQALSPMRPVTFRARDGTELSGYLTKPAAPGQDPLPLVVFPHGGPEMRDAVEFNFIVQFLASKGAGAAGSRRRGHHCRSRSQ